MDTLSTAKYLSELNAPDLWEENCPSTVDTDKYEAFQIAGKLWLQRLSNSGLLIVHPNILKQLEAQDWKANDSQKKMIWASVLATLDGKDSKKRFKEIKNYLLKKHGKDWWEEVYSLKNNAWAVKEWIRKCVGSNNSGVSALVNNTVLFGNIAEQERFKALSSLPES